MAKTPDQLEREAQQRNPAKYNERNPWPRVDQFVRERTPVDLQPSEDYSAIRAARTVTASRLDATDTIRELRAKQRRIDEQRDEQIANQNDPLSPEFYTPNGIPENEFLTTQYGERALLLEQRELERSLNRDISGYQSTRDIILRAREAGVELTADDINNMVEWTTLNSAADKVIALHKNGDVIGMRNVSLTLAGLSPEMAALLPDVVEEKIVESIEDPNLIAQFSGQIMTVLETVMAPFVAANEWVMEGTRAGFKEQADAAAAGQFTFGPVEFAQGFLSAETRSEVRQGDFNQEYISAIRASGDYSETEIDVALEVSRRKALGDPDPIISVYTDKYFGNQEVGRIVRDIMYNRGDIRVQDLLRQIDSAHLGNSGQVMFGAADETAVYDPARASELRQDLANITGFTASVVLDPTIFGSKALRLLQASKFAVAQLAPNALKGGSVASVIKQARFGVGSVRLNNPVYRFFDNFTSELNRLDDLKTRAAAATDASERSLLESQAASLRQRIARQYADMPDDLIDDFYTTMPRNADGKFDVDTAVQYIDETNAAYVTELGQVTDEVVAMGLAVDEIPRMVEKILNERDLYGKTFAGRVTATNMRRTPLAPRMSLVGALRRRAVNRLIANNMPQKKAVALVSKFVDDMTDPQAVAAGLSDNAVDIGTAAREYKRGAGLLDSGSRLFSSIVTKGTVSLTSGADATQVYRYARMFFPKRTSELIANAFRDGNIGSRRLLMSGLIRSAAASRGIVMTQKQADEWVRKLLPGANDLGTGTRAGERYGLTVTDGSIPSQRLAQSLSDEVVDPLDEVPKSVSLSADRNGIEHALHLDQTSDNIALPSIREFEDLRGEIEFGRIPVGRYRNIVGTGFQKATDYWSIGTLFGFRFSIRNAIEEVGLYWLTGGTTRDYFKGRQMSQALRNAKPRVYVRMVEDKATGKRAPAYKGETPELIYRSSLGMFANKREWLKRQFAKSKSGKKVDDYFTEWQQHNGYRHWLADLILPSVRRDDSYMALQDLAKGDPEAFQRLAVKSLAAQKIGKVLLDDDDLRAFEFLAGSVHGNALVDEIAEASRYLNDGGFPRFLEGVNGLSDDIPPGVGVGKMGDYKFRLGAYGNVRPVQVDTDLNKTVLGTSFWWRELQRTVDGDGTIGEVALRGIREIDRGIPTSVAEIKARIAQAIREDDTYNYAERLSRITDDASIDEFADAYFENVLAHVQRADGSINGDLVGQFFNESGDFTGWWKKVVDEEGNEVATPVISSKSLQKYSKDARPNAVFGREVDESPYIPFAESLPRLLSVNRAYGWMGAQNARLSREPIFLANYVDQFRQTAQARSDMREALARSLRDKADGAELSDEQMAAIEAISDGIYARQSMDNALNLSLSFMDNPANRSNLAWKSRNISRYYRATEDFYRRLKRTGITSPEAYWKAALIYHLMDDTGFVFSDDNGNKYFAYPGNEILQEVSTNLMARFMGVEITGFRDVDPFLIGGRVLGLTPSADVNQFAPSLSGPISGVFLGGFFQKFPALQGLRSALLGTYSQQADNMWQEILSAAVPAGVSRAITLMDPEQRDSMLVQSGVDTLAIMAAEGHLDEVTIITEDGTKRVLAGTAIDPETFKQTEEYKAAQAISVGYFIAKSALSWIVAAYPQTFGNTATDFARSSGIDDMQDANRDIRDIVIDPDFAEMLANHADAANPWAAATSEWFGMKASEVIDGPYASMSTLMPFTMSSYKTAGDAVSKIASVQTSKELVDWLRTEEASDLKKAGFGSVRFFLAPREGEFTWPAWNTVKNVLGIKVLKSEDEQIEELLALNGQATENMIRSEYRERMDAAANSPDRLAAIAEEQANELKYNRALNPAWDAVKGSATGVYTEANMRKAFGQMRDMLAYLEEKNGTLTPTQEAIDSAINVYLDYASQKSYIVGQTNEAKFERKRLDGYMQREWQIIRNQDENAAFFIDAVLEGLAYDPVYMNAFGDK